jgi:hypothetical protein
VVLLDDVDYRARQMMLVREFDAVGHMLLDHPRGFRRREIRMRIRAITLVFAEEKRIQRLADVVEERANPCEERFAPIALAAFSGQLRDDESGECPALRAACGAGAMIVVGEFQQG